MLLLYKCDLQLFAVKSRPVNVGIAIPRTCEDEEVLLTSILLARDKYIYSCFSDIVSFELRTESSSWELYIH